MASIAERLASLETSVIQIQKDTDDIKNTLSDIWKKVNSFPCGVQKEKIEGLETRVNWLYFAFVIVVVGGIVLGVWLK